MPVTTKKEPFYYFRLAHTLNVRHRDALLARQAFFRGSRGSVSLISYQPHRPQSGLSKLRAAQMADDAAIAVLFGAYDLIEEPGRKLPEKRLQSHILRKAFSGTLPEGCPYRLVTDELALTNPIDNKRRVIDIVGFNTASGALVLAELKYDRLLTELEQQLISAHACVRADPAFFRQLLSIHGFDWKGPDAVEQVMVWPHSASMTGHRPAAHLRVIGYEEQGDTFQFFCP